MAPIFASFAAIAARQPDALCLVSGARHLTYADMHERALVLAARIAAHTRPGDGVAILLGDEFEVALAQLACLATGRIALLLNAAHPAERLGAILAQAAPALLLMSPGLLLSPSLTLPATTAKIPRLHDVMAAHTPAPPGFTPTPADLDAPAMVIYTSGSTGMPKGFSRTQGQILDRCQGNLAKLSTAPTDRVLTLFSLTNGTGLSCLITTWLAGATQYVVAPGSQGLRGLLTLIRTQAITMVWAIPTMLRTLLALPGAALAVASVRATYSVSEAILRSDLIAWRRVLGPDCALFASYGMTEATSAASWFLPQMPPEATARLPAGYPDALYDFAITAPDGRAVQPGEEGELWVRGTMVTHGEWREGACFPGRAIVDPSDPRQRILRTHDRVRLRADGLLELAGRADDMIKIRGNRVEPAEIEEALRRRADIADVVVLPRRTATETRLIAYVVRAPNATVDQAALFADLRAALPGYMVPAQIEFLSALPRLPNGKVDVQYLAKRGE